MKCMINVHRAGFHRCCGILCEVRLGNYNLELNTTESLKNTIWMDDFFRIWHTNGCISWGSSRVVKWRDVYYKYSPFRLWVNRCVRSTWNINDNTPDIFVLLEVEWYGNLRISAWVCINILFNFLLYVWIYGKQQWMSKSKVNLIGGSFALSKLLFMFSMNPIWTIFLHLSHVFFQFSLHPWKLVFCAREQAVWRWLLSWFIFFMIESSILKCNGQPSLKNVGQSAHICSKQSKKDTKVNRLQGKERLCYSLQAYVFVDWDCRTKKLHGESDNFQ